MDGPPVKGIDIGLTIPHCQKIHLDLDEFFGGRLQTFWSDTIKIEFHS
jgi:hypothetical protein